MKTVLIPILMILLVGCGKTPPTTTVKAPLSDSDFEVQATALLAGKWINHDEYEAGEAWDTLRDSIDPADISQLSRWLTLQKQLLCTNSVPEGVQRSAMQEFYIYFEAAREHEAWLRQCQKSGCFVDPFINENLSMILETLD